MNIGIILNHLITTDTKFICFLVQVELSNYLYDRLSSVPSVRVYGPKPSRSVTRAALCSFNVEDVHPTDIATFLDQQV